MYKQLQALIVAGSVGFLAGCSQETKTPTAPEQSAMIGRYSNRAQFEDVIELRKGLYRCEAYLPESNGNIRIANIRIPRKLKAEDLTEGMRLVGIRLSSRVSGSSIDLHCGIPRDADVTEVLGSLRYELVAPRLSDPRSYTSYSAGDIESHRARAVGVRRLEADWLSRPRRQSGLLGLGSVTSADCWGDTSGECIGGMTTTADPYSYGPNNGNNGGSGDGGLDGYMGRTDPGEVLSVDDPDECVYNCNSTPAPPAGCDFSNPPPGGCHIPFTQQDTIDLRKAVNAHLRTSFTDPLKAARCAQLKGYFDTDFALGGGALQMGVNNTGTPQHEGASWGGEGHIDPRMFDSVRVASVDSLYHQRALANVALHELGHLNNVHHIAEPLGPYMSSPFFNQLNDPKKSPQLPPDPNSCIVW